MNTTVYARAAVERESKPFHILHVLDHSVPLHSGYAFRTLAILEQQRALGWRTSHLTGPRHTGCNVLCEEVDGWRFWRTPATEQSVSLAGFREWHVVASLEERLEEVARQLRPDVLHAHSPVLTALATLRVGRRLGIPVVYEVRAFWEDAAVSHGTGREGGLRYRLARALETWVLRRVDAVTTICEGLRCDIVERGVDSTRVTVIPNAVDVDRFAFAPGDDPVLRSALGLNGNRILGFIGSFYAYEGLEVLIDALPLMLRDAPDVRILLVGGGPEEERLHRQVEALGVAEQVVFTGRVPHEEIGRYYNLVDLLVYPRRSMRLTELVTPLKPLEAMAQGRLLIASDVGGHRELVRDGETGVLFRADDPEDLAKTVHTVLGHPERWPELRTAARQFVEEERSWPASVARYRDLYRGLAPREASA